MFDFASNFRAVGPRERFATKTARSYRTLPFLTFLFLFGFFASGATAATGQDVPHAPVGSVGPGPSFAIADFDGDQRPDLASVEGGQSGSSLTYYWIRFQLTAVGPQAIQLLAPSGGLAIEARDVNGDHAVDLVLTTAWHRQPVAVLLNDGHGSFSRAEPSQFPGAFGDSKRNWGSSTNQASEAIGTPPQPRPGICSDATNLPDVREPTDSVLTSRSGFPLDSFLIAYAERAPPSEVSYL